MQNKYGMAVGKWKLEVNGFDKELTPKKGDARRLLNIFTKSRDNGQEWLFDQFNQFMYDLIGRDYPPVNDDEKNELEMFIEYNMLKLLEEAQIAFRFTSREELIKLKKDMLQVQPEKVTQQKKPMTRSNGSNTIGQMKVTLNVQLLLNMNLGHILMMIIR